MSDAPETSYQAGRQRDLDREQAIADLEQSIADRDQADAREDQKVEDEEHPPAQAAPAEGHGTGAEPQSRHQEALDYTQAKHGRHQRRLDRAQAGRTVRQVELDAEPAETEAHVPSMLCRDEVVDPEVHERDEAALTRAEAAVERAKQALERAEAARDRAV